MEDAQSGDAGWWSECWLAATTEEIDPEEVRSHWNANEAPTIDSLRDRAPMVELGPLYADATDLLDTGPARRVFDLLFLRGTTPDYVLPVVGDALISEIVGASHSQAHDRVTSPTTPNEVEAFLSEHRGWHLVIVET
jgi:hypothetical protein